MAYLASSEGCIDNGPIYIHLVAPFILGTRLVIPSFAPIVTNNKSAKRIIYIGFVNFLS